MNMYLVLIFMMVNLNLSGQELAIDKNNWFNHPARLTIKKIVTEIDSLCVTKDLKIVIKSKEYSEPYDPTTKTYYVDSKSSIRKYVEESGSDDSALKFQYYYDTSFTLRFVFITGGAVNGSQLEHRIYFNESGIRIWETHEYVKGPGYTFPEKWPDDQLVFKPIINN